MDVLTISPCPFEPVSVDEMRVHCRIDSGDEDEYLHTLIGAARRYVELKGWRTLMPATHELTLQCWPSVRVIELPQGPATAIVSVKYVTEAAGEQTLSGAAYYLDAVRGVLSLKRGQAWPGDQLIESSPIRVRYTAGYSAVQLSDTSSMDDVNAARSAIPVNLRHAIKLTAAHWYENREQVTIQAGVSSAVQLPMGVDALIDLDRPFRW